MKNNIFKYVAFTLLFALLALAPHDTHAQKLSERQESITADNTLFAVQDSTNAFAWRKVSLKRLKEIFLPFRTPYGNVPTVDSNIVAPQNFTVSKNFKVENMTDWGTSFSFANSPVTGKSLFLATDENIGFSLRGVYKDVTNSGNTTQNLGIGFSIGATIRPSSLSRLGTLNSPITDIYAEAQSPTTFTEHSWSSLPTNTMLVNFRYGQTMTSYATFYKDRFEVYTGLKIGVSRAGAAWLQVTSSAATVSVPFTSSNSVTVNNTVTIKDAMTLQSRTTLPSSPEEGTMVLHYTGSRNILKIFANGTWVGITP